MIDTKVDTKTVTVACVKAQEKTENLTGQVVGVLRDVFKSVDGVIGLVGSVARLRLSTRTSTIVCVTC